MKFGVMTGIGVVLLVVTSAILTTWPWPAVGSASLVLGIGCHLHRRRSRVDADALHLGRIVLISGGAMTLLSALVATDSPLKWIVLVPSMLPILPAYLVGFMGLICLHTIGCLVLLGILVASGPEKPRVSSGSTSRG